MFDVIRWRIAAIAAAQMLGGNAVVAIERNGLSETTRVAYTSDHGDNVGARGTWGKSTHFDDAPGVPLILAGPHVPKGRVCRTPVSLVDFAPTILEAVGAEPLARVHKLPGRSLFTIAAGSEEPEWTIFSEYDAFGSPTASFMPRNGQWQYVYHVGYPPELFDFANDPFEERRRKRSRATASVGSVRRAARIDSRSRGDRCPC